VTDASIENKSRKVGKLRPSQAVTQHGPGAVIDLPELSVIVAGIDRWYVSSGDRILEPRLEAFIESKGLFRAPKPGPGKFGGIPAFVFPEYLVCPYQRCRRLAPFHDFSFAEYPGEFRCDAPVHGGGRKPAAFPARFMVACAHGHLDDFPWRSWAHGGATGCQQPLRLEDRGSTGSANDLVVKCSCGESAALGNAFRDGAHEACTGRQPWISRNHYDGSGCDQRPRTILRGASNAYFAVATSAISIPPWSDPIFQDIAPYMEIIEQPDSLEKLKAGIELGFYKLDELLTKYTVEQIWEARERKGDPPKDEDLRTREYQALLNPEQSVEPEAEFEASFRPVASGYAKKIRSVVAVTRLREVRALRAFTRIDSIPEVGERHDVSALEAELAPIGTNQVKWRPATELRGEGVFLELGADAVTRWETDSAVAAWARELAPVFERSWQNRGEIDFPGARYVLLHTLAHVLMRQMSLDAGYSSSALRERIYCSEEMSGLLIYTASSDSDGSLGGLVDLAQPARLGPLLELALKSAGFCASDPLCSAGRGTSDSLNGAACHACLLLAETSCELSNRLLDRACLVPTLVEKKRAFFDGG
jgi:hypothetical protein